MRCPYCSSLENKVVDSRMGKEGESIRRRRECLKCEGRFTTYERVEEVLPLVIKKDGRREPFDRLKILNGLKKACEKRPVGVESIETTVSDIEKSLQDKGLKEIPSTVIGEEVMDHLHRLDEVAYVTVRLGLPVLQGHQRVHDRAQGHPRQQGNKNGEGVTIADCGFRIADWVVRKPNS